MAWNPGKTWAQNKVVFDFLFKFIFFYFLVVFSPVGMPFRGKTDDATSHLSITEAGKFGDAGHAGIVTNVRVGIYIQNEKNIILIPDVKTGVIPASQSPIGGLAHLLQGLYFFFTKRRRQ